MPHFDFDQFNIKFPINSNVNNFYETSYKIRLIKDTKNATSDWLDRDSRKWKQNFKVSAYNNLAAPCGSLNDLLVVDLDIYKLKEGEKCEILETFYNNNVMNHRGIVQKTPQGGYHIFFRHREGLKNCTGYGKYGQIDIRTDGGYIVLSPSKINGQTYEILKNEPLEQMSDEMFNFILGLKNVKLTEEKKAKKKAIKDHSKHFKDEDITAEKNTAYHIDETEFREVINKLPEETFTDYGKWLHFTTMCKILNFQNVWDEINKTKPNYDETNNLKTWEAVDVKYDGVMYNVLGKKYNSFRDMFKYIREPENKISAEETFHRNKVGYDYLQDNINYIIKSDTGTGKTTAFKSYVDKTDRPFLSIVSRISLADSQFDSFTKNCNRIIYH